LPSSSLFYYFLNFIDLKSKINKTLFKTIFIGERMSAANYNPNSFLITRFVNHFKLGTTSDLTPYNFSNEVKQNFLEQVGNAGLYIQENLPGKFWGLVRDPRVVTIALTILTLYAESFAFYPSITSSVTKKAVNFIIEKAPLWAVKFAIYITLVESTFSLAMRACGRFNNEQIMQQFYKPNTL
jgi:hypothetical protein